jgi:crotonobetainyl-CoA:carnitine CoA-transferase CaiB-like acyl-CoA transferase
MEPAGSELADVSPIRTPGRVMSLDGLTVVDLSRVLTGPFAAMLLGDLGARVIKVERPGTGDETRHWGPPFLDVEDGEAASTYFLSVNRNKESISLDLHDAVDLERLKKLVGTADIVVENFRPGVLDRLGVGHAVMQELNPRAVILSISGFGPDGEMNTRAGYDQIVQGEAGLMSVTGSPVTGPMKMGIPVADLSAALFGVVGALAALEERHRTGRGRVVFTSLLSASVGLHTFQGARWLTGGEVPKAEGNLHPTVCPYGAYECADGGLVQVAVGNDSLWRRFAAELGWTPTSPSTAPTPCAGSTVPSWRRTSRCASARTPATSGSPG